MASYYEKSPAMIIQKGKRVKYNPFLMPLAGIAIYSMIIPVFILDIWTRIYQAIYFPINEIPRINRKDYVSFERWNLKKLTLLQKIDCVYCEYVNGTLAWTKAVGNQTEVYSCAIKHQFLAKPSDHEKDFTDPSEFK